MASIQFATQLVQVGGWTILRLPEDASAQLPSRGLTMVRGTINGAAFHAALEPDGRYAPGQQPSHWFCPADGVLAAAGATSGTTVDVVLEPTKDWIEPDIPDDLQQALNTSLHAATVWQELTPLARWEWIRWIRAVKTQETRQKHIAVALDKLNKGMRRPCCFNRNLCSEPAVSHNWVLRDPSQP